MKSVWNSNLSRDIKVSFFQATVESVLLYGCESWTLKKTLRKSLDGCYTRMLRAVLNVNWSERVSNERLYGVLPPKLAGDGDRLLFGCIGQVVALLADDASHLRHCKSRKLGPGMPCNGHNYHKM